MASYRIPPDSNEPSEKKEGNQDEERKSKLPEFVILEPDASEKLDDLGATPHDPRQMFGSIQTMSKGRHPFYLRILSLIASCIFLVLAGTVLILWLLFLAISLLFFRQSSQMNAQAATTWRWFKKLLVFTLGSFVSTFNFSLGVGIVLMYFMLAGEKLHSRLFQEFTKYQK